MSNVTPIRRCVRCSKSGSRRELLLAGRHVAEFSACEECVARADGRLARVRPVFDAMIEAGVDRDIANETMTFLLDRMPE